MTWRTQSLLLLMFGGALLRLATTDALLRYVRPVARPWVLLAGLAMAGLALWSLAARPGDDAHRDGGERYGPSRAGWLVLAPVVAIVVVAPPALGAYSAARIPMSAVAVASRHLPPLRGADPVRMSLLDYFARAAFDAGHTLRGHHVSLTGFVLRREPRGFELARLVITCCAADARPVVVSVLTQPGESGVPPPNTWVTLSGTYGGQSASDSTVPVLLAESVSMISQPADPYD